MYHRTHLALLALLLIPLGVAAEGWQAAARQLPPPAGASDQLQAAIAEADSPNTRARAIVPKDNAQWRLLIAARAAGQVVSLPQLEQALQVRIKRDEIAGVPVHRVTPAQIQGVNRQRLFIYLHGGAYVFGGGDTSVREAALIASVAGIPTLSIDYRMPPDHPHPAAVEDVTRVYRQLLATYPAGAMAMGGTSAGGGLTLAAVHHLNSLQLAVPGALYLGTPWTDLTKSSDSLYTNEGVDRLLVTYDGLLAACAVLYAGGVDLKDPLLSPVYGDFGGFPPTYLVTGTRDLLLSDSVRVHRKLRAAGVRADLNVYEGISHAEYAMLPGSPEWQQVYTELAAFLVDHLAQPAPDEAVPLGDQ